MNLLGADGVERALPVLEGVATLRPALRPTGPGQLQGAILPAYLPTCRWYRSKARTILRVE